ncbi:MFS transporter asaE [Penicillium chermesinum]|nr:MFS transporter asaE [Penicillium chermesinum]
MSDLDQRSNSTAGANDQPIEDPEKGIQSGPKSNEVKYQDVTDKSPAPAAALPGPGPPPDGGFHAWLTVLGGFCGLFVSFGWINAIGVFQTYYESHQLRNVSPSTVAWVTSLESFAMFFGSPIFGSLFDSYGPRVILLGGTFFHVFGLMMTSLSSEYYQFILAQGICSPFGASAVFNACVNSVSTWFAKRRAFALGVMAAGSSLGGVIFPIMVSKLIPQVGFPWTMRICAFLILGMLGICNLTLKSRLTHQPKRVKIMSFVRPLKELKFTVTVAAAFFYFWGCFYHLLYSVELFRGYFADRFGRYNVMIFFAFFSGILVLALWLPSRGNAPAIVFSVLYGFGSGAFVSLVPALVAQISDLREVGMRNGTLFCIISFAALTGTPIGGALVPDVLHGSYTKLQIFCGVVILVGAVLFVVARIIVGGLVWKKV